MVPRYWFCSGVEVLVAEHQLGEPEDGVHGGADFVRHVGQEGALGAVGGLGGFLGLGHLFLDAPPLGHVFHGQDQQLAVVARLQLAGVEQHHPAADDREGVLQLEVVEDGALGDDVLEQGPQVGDVPLAVAQLVDEAVLGLLGRDVERLIEGAVGGPDAQGGVEDQQRLAHRVDDVLGVGFDGLQIRLGAPPLGHVLHRQDQQLAVVARLELAGVEQHHPAADDREGVLELEVVEDGALGDDVLEQGPQVGDVPLAVAQLVDEAALGLPGRDVERLVEGAVGGPDAQRGVEDQQRLAHRVDDVLGVVLNILDQRSSFHTAILLHASRLALRRLTLRALVALIFGQFANRYPHQRDEAVVPLKCANQLSPVTVRLLNHRVGKSWPM